ncbi:MAG: hypothetical protein R2828_10045 [Saprospiraceae bacterium]
MKTILGEILQEAFFDLTIFRAIKNGRISREFYGEKVSVKKIVKLLENASKARRHFAVKYHARALLKRMATVRWAILAGRHIYGRGGGGRAPDGTWHYTIYVGRRRYHLRLNKSGHIFDITGGNLPEFAPWAKPGTSTSKKNN